MKKPTIFLALAFLLVLGSAVKLPFNFLNYHFPDVFRVKPGLPNVLLIGDSIQLGYYPLVAEELAEKANVYKVAEWAPQRWVRLIYAEPRLQPVNATTTMSGLNNLDEWLGDEHWDVIHFNWGLHNLIKYEDLSANESALGEAIQQYKSTLQMLTDRLVNTKATLVFATTTPVTFGTGYIPEMVVDLNDVAKEIMNGHDIRINDLYNLALPRLSQIQPVNDIHFNKAGTELLASSVETSILQALENRLVNSH